MGEESRSSETQTGRFRFGLNDDSATGWLPAVTTRDFGRVTVILGANGCGKSKLLRMLSRKPVVNDVSLETIFVEGGRALQIPNIASPKRRSLRQFQVDAVEVAKKNHHRKNSDFTRGSKT